jgi:hypothetical protein
MNWGEIQIESLKKMFLNTENLTVNNLSTYLQDKKYKTYLFAMPQACNEAIRYLASQLGTEAEKYTLEYSGESTFNLSDYIPDMRKIENIICPIGVKYKMLTNSIIQFYNWDEGDIDIYYEVEPEEIKSSTAATKKIDSLKYQYVRIIPLYIAGELYKDDDLSLSTMYMNEFLNMVTTFKDEDIYVNNPTIQTIYRIGG